MAHECRLLPLIIEHTIDERSPLIGHTYESLMAVRALCLESGSTDNVSSMAVYTIGQGTVLVPMCGSEANYAFSEVDAGVTVLLLG